MICNGIDSAKLLFGAECKLLSLRQRLALSKHGGDEISSSSIRAVPVRRQRLQFKMLLFQLQTLERFDRFSIFLLDRQSQNAEVLKFIHLHMMAQA